MNALREDKGGYEQERPLDLIQVDLVLVWRDEEDFQAEKKHDQRWKVWERAFARTSR